MLKVLFAGSPEVAVPSLRMLAEDTEHFEVVAVLTRPLIARISFNIGITYLVSSIGRAKCSSPFSSQQVNSLNEKSEQPMAIRT